MIGIQKSIPSCEAVKKQILSQFSFFADSKCIFFNVGINDTYKILNNNREYFLRIYTKDWRKYKHIYSEIELLLHLHKNKISVPKPIKNENNEYIIEVYAPEGMRYAALFESTKGIVIDKTLNVDQIISYGQIAAKIHIESDKLNKLERFNIDLEYLIDEPIRSIKSAFPKRKEEIEYLVETSNKLREIIHELVSTDEIDTGICHGDFNNGNISFDSNNNISVFDFDCFGYGWRAYDFAVFLWSRVLFSSWSTTAKKIRMQSYRVFLQAYSSLKPINEKEILASFVFVPIRHIWVMGLKTKNIPNQGLKTLDDDSFESYINFIKAWIDYYGIFQKELLVWDIIKEK